MRSLLCCCLVFGLSLQARAVDPADAAQTLKGTWRATKAELSGKPLPDEAVKSISLKLEEGKYEVSSGGELDKGACRINPKATPGTITLTGMAGPNSGKVFPGIYALDGDTLRICYDLSGAGRPKDFKTAADTSFYCVTYQRKSPRTEIPNRASSGRGPPNFSDARVHLRQVVR